MKYDPSLYNVIIGSNLSETLQKKVTSFKAGKVWLVLRAYTANIPKSVQKQH